MPRGRGRSGIRRRRVSAKQPSGGKRARATRRRSRRTDLLERVADHLLRHGIATFSLRSAARLVGASARMLVHYFGSKERLLTEALATIRERQVAHFTRARRSPVSSFDAVFRESWTVLAAADFRRYFCLNHELLALALREPRRYRTFLTHTTEAWRSSLANALVGLGFSASESDILSTVYMAALRGLLLDLAVTKDSSRVEKAIDVVADRLKQDLARGPSR